ncbi:RNA polymerase sigma factor SigD [Anatilimnocola aggregata]|uniref:RNA polymerase sigma factor SigD n=1 Tax=Anatilimnocola aggregata TaxID=2528021 RepID=A0A517YDJ5_9BACT|nr:sigma-70 family RNA polymerase sigma factor [Anatilimnocola aggregata]QDU28300.1 RNA polymerase sigma factor SigD [Anatilimnocola aggregata]
MTAVDPTSTAEFADLIGRVRLGDQQAATVLVRRYEPEVRRFIRFRLSTPALRRTMDSLDICQSVLCKFFVEISAGRLELQEPRQLAALLITMARNKVCDRVREAQADCRDARRQTNGGEDALLSVAAPGESPSEALIVREILDAVGERLSADDRYLVQQRMGGRSWDDLASELGGNADAIRKRMTRAIDAAATELGIRES